MTAPTFLTRREAHEEGWFSRRHETPKANRIARERYRTTRGEAARIHRAKEWAGKA